MRKYWITVPGLLWGALLPSLPVLADTSAAVLQPVALVDAWVRALPPTQSSTAAYLTVKNTSGARLEISGARSEVAGRVEMHRSREIDGMMRMERVERVPLAAGAVLEFAPGGLHLMLLELQRMPAEGDSVPLCLELTGGTPVCTLAPVRRDVAGSEHEHHQHD